MLLTCLSLAVGLAVVGIVATYGVSLACAGVSIQKSVTRSGDGSIGHEVTLPAAKAGTLSTRTDNDTGVVTLSGGHGIATSDVVDVYWTVSGGGVRYGMTATVATNDVTVDGGAGDNLPAQASAVTLVKQVTIVTAIDGDNVEILGFSLEFTDASNVTSKGHVDCQDSGDASIEEIDLTANTPVVYDIDGGASNVFTGNIITTVKASNGDSSNSATLKIVGVQDSSS